MSIAFRPRARRSPRSPRSSPLAGRSRASYASPQAKRGFYLVDATGNRLAVYQAATPSQAAKKALSSDFLKAQAIRGDVTVRILDDSPRVFEYVGRLESAKSDITFTDKKTGERKTVSFKYKPVLRATGTAIVADPRAQGYATRIKLSPFIYVTDSKGKTTQRQLSKVAKKDREAVQGALRKNAKTLALEVASGVAPTRVSTAYTASTNEFVVSVRGELSKAQHADLKSNARAVADSGVTLAGHTVGFAVKDGVTKSSTYTSYNRPISPRRK
jgi:hypothetical protein